ncbi:MAG: TonB-dependent receptor [Porticoccaceae bacterium]
MKRFKQKSTYLSLAVSAFLAAGSAIAEIEEITVTANKREQSLQDVPLTVAVTSSETIQQSSIVDLIDLQTAVPALRVNQLQNSAQTNFTIRGFGNGANNPGIEPSVLVVVDGVPRSRSSSSLADLPNIERIEVLSGPQSTLFGKNASAGVISITTKAPEEEMGGVIEATLGNYGSQIIKGTLTGSTGIENLTYRISASTNENDGYATNLGTSADASDDSPLNNRDRSAFRAQLQWDAAADLTARLIYDKDKIDEVCCVTGPLFAGGATSINNGIVAGAFGPQDLGIRGFLQAEPNANPWDYQIYMNFEPTNVAENEGFSLHIEKDLGNMALTSITSDRNTEMQSNFDADFSAAHLVSEQALHYQFDTFTQELRLSSTDESGIQWTAGLFYSDEDTVNNRTVLFGPEMSTYADLVLGAGTPGLLGLISGFDANVSSANEYFVYDSTNQNPGGSTQELFNMNSETVSLFANVDIPLADDWTATVGLNKTHDKKTVVSDVRINDKFSEADLSAIADTMQLAVDNSMPIAVAPGVELPADQVISPLHILATRGATIAQFFPEFTNYPNDAEDGIFKSDDLTHTLRLTHDLSESTKVYASHSTGFKPISVNLSVNAVNSSMRSADEEYSENLEVGVKHTMDNGYINVAMFSQKIEGFQSNTFNGQAFELTNAGNQKHMGFELDMKQQVSEDWLVGLSAMYIDAEYLEYDKGPCDHVTDATNGFAVIFDEVKCDLWIPDNNLSDKGWRNRAGETPAGIHDWSANLNATYSFNVSDAVSSFLRLEYVYESEAAVVENVPSKPEAYVSNTNIPAVRSSKNFNMSMGFNHAPSGIEVMLWGRNLTNHQALLSAFPTTAAPGSYGGYPTAPKTYGLTARAAF